MVSFFWWVTYSSTLLSAKQSTPLFGFDKVICIFFIKKCRAGPRQSRTPPPLHLTLSSIYPPFFFSKKGGCRCPGTRLCHPPGQSPGTRLCRSSADDKVFFVKKRQTDGHRCIKCRCPLCEVLYRKLFCSLIRTYKNVKNFLKKQKNESFFK